MNRIPILLIFSRGIIGALLVVFSYGHISGYPLVAVTLFSIGLLTDIFDGIIARRLNVSSPLLRRLDSTTDQVFFLFVVWATFIECPDFFISNSIALIILVGVEALTYAVSYLRFRKEVATHAISSKIWTLILFATLIQVMLTCNSGTLFWICFWAGILTRLENMAILLTLRVWTTDVPSIYHAVMLRQGKSIKRHKLFNG